MKPEEQRIALAEFCGWRHGYIEENSFADPKRSIKHERWISPGGIPQRVCPDYLEDLNAMHEVEKLLLTGDGWKDRLSRYSSKLMSVIHETDFGRIDVAFKNDMVHLRYFTLHATAAQRAEALLRTIGKWTTTPQ